MSLTILSLARNNLIIPAQVRERLVSDIPAGDGNVANLFYSALDDCRGRMLQCVFLSLSSGSVYDG